MSPGLGQDAGLAPVAPPVGGADLKTGPTGAHGGLDNLPMGRELPAAQLGFPLAPQRVGEASPTASVGLEAEGPKSLAAPTDRPQGERSFGPAKLEPEVPAHAGAVQAPNLALGGARDTFALPGTRNISNVPTAHLAPQVPGQPIPAEVGAPDRSAAAAPSLRAAPDARQTAKLDLENSHAGPTNGLSVARGREAGKEMSKDAAPSTEQGKVVDPSKSEFRNPMNQWLERLANSRSAQLVVGAIAGYVISAQMGNPSWKWAVGGAVAAIAGGFALGKYMDNKKTQPGMTLADMKKL